MLLVVTIYLFFLHALITKAKLMLYLLDPSFSLFRHHFKCYISIYHTRWRSESSRMMRKGKSGKPLGPRMNNWLGSGREKIAATGTVRKRDKKRELEETPMLKHVYSRNSFSNSFQWWTSRVRAFVHYLGSFQL